MGSIKESKAKQNLHLHIPRLAQCMNQIRPLGRQLIIHPPRRRQLTRPALKRRLERKQTHNIPRISVKDLLVRRVRGGPNLTVERRQMAQVLDVCQDDIGRCLAGGIRGIAVVLSTALRGNVRREAGVDDDVFLARVVVDAETAEDKEAVAEVKLVGEAAELGVEGGKGEGGLGYV